MPSLRTAIHSKNFPKPTGAGIVNLKMKDGGQVSPWSLKGMGQSLVNAASSVVASPAEKRANASLRTPAPATAAPAPTPAPAPAQIAAPMGSQSVIDRRMAAAGLRNGGELHLLEGGPQDIGVDPATAGKIAADAKAQHMGIMARTSSTLGQMNTIAGATPDSAATPAAPMSTSMPSLRGGGLPMAQPMTASGDAWAFGQLQNGGTVPGSGEGDKVPAMYEPGEFVVSNDMLDAAPSLRGELQGLRAHVLAKKGMTPAEADAKSLRGPVVHALHGLEIPGMITSEAPMTGDEAALFGKYKAPPVNAQGVPASAAPMTSAAPKAPMNMDPTAGSLIRDKMLGSAKDWKGTVDTLTKEHSLPGAKLAGTALKAVAAPLSAYQTYQDIGKGEYGDAALHGLDTAAGAALFTPAAPAAGLYLGARGAYEAPEALRGAIGEKGMNTLGGVINQVGQNTGLWGTDNTDGDARVAQMLGNGQTATPANKPSLRLPVNQRGQGYLDPRRTDVNPADPRLGQSRDFSNELNGAKAPLPSDLREGVVHKTVDAQGRVTYSGRNVGVNGNGETQMVDGKGRDLKMLNGNNSSYTYSVGADGKRNGPTVSAFSDGQTGSTSTTDGGISLRGSQGGGNALHGARMDAAKRGDWGAVNASLAAQGQAPVKGTDTGGGGSPRDMIMDRLRGAGKLSVAGLKLAQDLTNSDNQLRGHQMAYNSSMTGHDTAREGHQLTSANNKARLQYDINKDHRDFGVNQQKTAFEQGNAADKAANEMFERTFRTTVDGKDVPDTAKISEYTRSVNATLPDLQAQLRKMGTPEALAKADDIGKKGMAALDKSDHEHLMTMQAHKDRLQQTHGNVFGSTHKQSSSLYGYRQKAGTNAKDGNVYYENGSMAPTKHLNFTEPGNFALPDWLKQRSDRLTRGLNLTTD